MKLIYLLITFLSAGAATDSPSAKLSTAHIVSGNNGEVEEKARNVGNTPGLALDPIHPNFNYEYHCPGTSSREVMTFSFDIFWMKYQRRVQYMHTPASDTVASITMEGNYPYLSTAIFDHHMCRVQNGKACSYYYEAQILVRIADKMTAQPAWNMGPRYFQPTITEHCVHGSKCSTERSTPCIITDVYTN